MISMASIHTLSGVLRSSVVNADEVFVAVVVYIDALKWLFLQFFKSPINV